MCARNTSKSDILKNVSVYIQLIPLLLVRFPKTALIMNIYIIEFTYDLH